MIDTLWKYIQRLKPKSNLVELPSVRSTEIELPQNLEEYFLGYHGNSLEWLTCEPMDGILESLYYCGYMPNIRCTYTENGSNFQIGRIEEISLFSGGIVVIRHFALDEDLTQSNIGIMFFKSILRFFKKHNALSVEFHEDHSSKINHYRRFFEKLGVEEIKNRVWKIDLYEKNDIPKSVIDFQNSLVRDL
jgi:hypothetical protein